MLMLTSAIHMLTTKKGGGKKNTCENLAHILREMKQGNQKLAAQLDSKMTEITASQLWIKP